jgi:hypothetical protein
VLKKASRKSRAAVDVPADNPTGTMERFTDGLRRVLSAPKRFAAKPPPKKARKA